MPRCCALWERLDISNKKSNGFDGTNCLTNREMGYSITMKQMGKAVNVDGRWMAEIIRNEACASCGACNHGRVESRHYPLPDDEYTQGQDVEIELPDSGAFLAAAIGYGIPLVCMIAALAIAVAAGLGDLWQAVIGIASLVVSFFILRALEPRIRKSALFSPKFTCKNQQ